MRKVKDLRKWIAYYDEAERLVEEVALALEYYKEEITTEEEVDDAYGRAIHLFEEVELKNMLRAEEDNLGAVLKINAGAGGTESQDWASMLARMYGRWCDKQGYKTTITNWQDGDEAGIKTMTMQVEGDQAYGFLKSETGVHRLAYLPLQRTGEAHDELCLRLRRTSGRRYHRGGDQSGQYELGHLPLQWCRWAERQQGRDRRTPTI